MHFDFCPFETKKSQTGTINIVFADHLYELYILHTLFSFAQDEKGSSPRFEALDVMAENICEICLRHPVAVKYVDRKWRKRGFKYTVALILLTLLFHICLMVYTTDVIGVVNKQRKYTYIRLHV